MKFYKYQGAGNDFIIIDDRNQQFSISVSFIENLCNRHFGIGADGLILLQHADNYDFKMVYFNADGKESTMCGNGGRCITMFAKYLGIINEKATFIAIDGIHHAEIENDLVNLQMIDVDTVENLDNDYVLHTGSPHYVRFIKNLADFDVVMEARKIRYSDKFAKSGINVNFVEVGGENNINIRTYERGVEDETLACGTGVTAAALVYGRKIWQNHIYVKAKGGDLEVKFTLADEIFTNIWLKGPAKMVFSGDIHV
jgi:diaminopimelate epimerase